MIATPRILSVMEERCRRTGAKLHDKPLTCYQLTDVETVLRLIDGAIARYLRDSLDRYGSSETLCSAQVAHTRMRDRLQLMDRHRDNICVKELRGFLLEVQDHALEALLAIQRDLKSKPTLLVSN